MRAEEITVMDWGRMLVGDNPAAFFAEAVFRALVIVVLLLTSIRFLGKRMAAEMSQNELVSVVVLAAAIGVPMQSPERGVLPAFVIAVVVVLLGRLVARLSFLNAKSKWSRKVVTTFW